MRCMQHFMHYVKEKTTFTLDRRFLPPIYVMFKFVPSLSVTGGFSCLYTFIKVILDWYKFTAYIYYNELKRLRLVDPISYEAYISAKKKTNHKSCEKQCKVKHAFPLPLLFTQPLAHDPGV